jgi:hypothetical protein
MALRGRWERVGAGQQVGDAVVVVRMVLSAETDTHDVHRIACHSLEPERLWVAIERTAGAVLFGTRETRSVSE